MMNTVALRLLGEVSWGLKLRVFIGAGMSVTDMASDINMIFFYLATPDQVWFGYALLSMIVVCVVMNFVCVFLLNRSNTRRMVKELLITLTGLKPG
jgi:hypothetical protein